ncbi:MAG: NAD(P)/FAD-dependent oxidoreductase [Gammaproteobacteria bacterium]|nr:NAD(P)/FAD-dependent oxidoreductase [Gammaproteobacteria bacterium]
MTDAAYDALVVGAGHNGLACAAYLARSGRKVLVLEAAERPGGLAATREFADGFRVSAAAHLLNMLSPEVAKDLALERHGLAYAARHLKTVVLPGDGRQLVIDGDRLEGASANDQAAFSEFQRQTQRFAKVLNRFCARPFPRLCERRRRDDWLLAKLAWDLRSLGKADLRELLRIGAINIHDLAQERFDNPLLKAALGMDAVLGSHMGPRSPNTVYAYLHRHLNDGGRGPALVKGGMGALGGAFAAAAEAAGATIRYGARVCRIDLADCRTVGVTLADGSALAAPLVASNADLASTFGLVGPLNLDAGFVRRVHNFRARGVTAKLHLALDGLPEFQGLNPADAGSRLLAAASMEGIEEAFNHAKYGECSPQPVMEISIPTVHDDSLAPPGKHVLSAVAQYAPYALKAGWQAGRETFMRGCLAGLEAVAPGIGERVIAAELLTPPDLEAQFGLRGGHWHHGEIALDQALFTRPVPGANHYATPVPGLYLCGASAHPGGGLLGLAGRNAAKAILAGEAAA